MYRACLASGWKTNEECHKQRNVRNEITRGHHDGTYVTTRNKLERIKERRKMEKISFSS